MKNPLKNYYKPTPAKWRKIGDALLAVSLFASPYEIIQNDHRLAIALIAIGVLGKFLTNFFAEDQK